MAVTHDTQEVPSSFYGPQPDLVSPEVTHRTHTAGAQQSRTNSSDSVHKVHHQAIDKEQQILAAELAKDEAEVEEDRARRKEFYRKFRPFILGGVALLILGWWISATVLKATRHRW